MDKVRTMHIEPASSREVKLNPPLLEDVLAKPDAADFKDQANIPAHIIDLVTQNSMDPSESEDEDEHKAITRV